MRVPPVCLFLGVILAGCSARVKRATSATLFESGKEYVYNYSTSVQASSSDYVHFTSLYKVAGKVHVASEGNQLTIKFSDLQFGAYNGKFSNYPEPPIPLQSYEELDPLYEPFIVIHDHGIVTEITLNGDSPQWARNLQRGLANTLQLNVNQVVAGKVTIRTVQETTILGDCKTDYQIIPIDDTHTKVRKFRSHAQCPNAPVQKRVPNVHLQYCPDDSSRDIFNSSVFTEFDLEVSGEQFTAKRISQRNTASFFLFGPTGAQQLSYTLTTLSLESVKDASNLGSPSNPQKTDNLRYVFERTDDEDEDLTKPTPFYFHQHHLDTSEPVQTTIMGQLEQSITSLIRSLRTTAAYTDIREFHRATPFGVIMNTNVLTYEHLKHCYEKFMADADGLKRKIFLDTLVVIGTGPAALLIRDIVKESDEPLTIARVLATFPAYVRNPTEKLIREFEPLLKASPSTRIEKVNGRLIDFAFASLVNRACKKEGCTQSGLLAKYVQYYSDHFDSATGFEEQTAAVSALRNIGLGGAAEKLLTIVQNRELPDSVRVQALPGLKYLTAKDPEAIKREVLPIFFDRTEHPELRAAAAKFIVYYAFEPEIITQIVVSMWTERCNLLKNYVYTLFQGIGANTRSCIQRQAANARYALTFYPPWEPNPKFSANYLSDYFDREFSFGQLTDYVVHKDGTTFLPTVLHFSFNSAIAGYGNTHLTAFLRLEGLGKAAVARVMNAATQITKFDDIKNVFSKIGVVARKDVPLKLEFGLMLQNRFITYHAADEKSLADLPALFQKLTQRAGKPVDLDLLHLSMFGGAMIETATEFGAPVSTLTSITGLLNLKAKVNRGKQGESLQQETDLRVQSHIFAISGMFNHFPALGIEHSVTAHRTMRIRQPSHLTLGIDTKQMSLSAVANVPKEEDPAMAMFHATALTTIRPDALHRYKSNKVGSVLAASGAKPAAVISKGEKYRETRQFGFLHKYLTGVKGGVQYFDCEKVHNPAYVIRQVGKIFGQENKNDGGRIMSRISLSLSYLQESLFFSPVTQTCGLKAYFYQDTTQKTVFDRAEGHIRAKYIPDPNKKLGAKVSAKSSLKLVYTGAEPKTRTFDLSGNFQLTGLFKRDLKLKLGLKDEILNKNGVVCIDVATQFSKPQDFFSYEGPNEPTAERSITIVYGSESKDGKEGSCPDIATSPNIKYVRKSHRSAGQREVAEAATHWPYSKCKAQKASGRYPGPLTPATEACVMAAFEQSKLREANITITYKVKPEARTRWSKPGAVLATLLMPYWVPEESVAAIDNHAAHHGTTEGGLIQGEFKVDATFDPDHAEADVHWHGSQGENEHYHGIDLDSLPIKLINPESTRFNGIQVATFKLGLYAYCDVTPGAVQTFDNVTYDADLSECPTLISADCSATPRYAVYARKIAADKLGVTVQLAGSKIELTDTNTATVDGNALPLGNEVFTLNEKKLFKIYRLNENNVFISSSTLGVHVRYTGHYATVTAGSRYRGVNCGLCGNFNDKESDEFTGPDSTCNALGPQDMVNAYVVRDGDCTGTGSACPPSV